MAYTSFMDWVSEFKGLPPHPAGCSPLEKLPNELLSRILQFVACQNQDSFCIEDNLPNNVNQAQNKSNILPCVLSSRRLYYISCPILYNAPKFARLEMFKSSPSFEKFIDILSQRGELCPLVRSLDIGQLGGCTPITLLQTCLSLTSRLKSLRLHWQDLCNEPIVRQVLFGMESLQALEICGQPSEHHTLLYHTSLMAIPPRISSRISSLSIENVNFGGLLEGLLPRLPNLRILDIKHSALTSKVLSSISPHTKLTHLILEGSRFLDEDSIIDILTTHPAMRDSLTTLNLNSVRQDSSRFLTEEHVAHILEMAPSCLRYLHLNRSTMTSRHVSFLQDLSLQLEELSIGDGLSGQDVERILLGRQYILEGHSQIDTPSTISLSKDGYSVLNPMSEAVSLCSMKHRLNTLPLNPKRPARNSRIRYLNIGGLSISAQGNIQNSLLLGSQANPLGVIELSDFMVGHVKGMERQLGSLGWRVRWVGRRVWIERV